MIGIFVGTRPELIKLKPVFQELRSRGIQARILYVKQHQGIEPEIRSLDPDCSVFAKEDTPSLPIAVGETIKLLGGIRDYTPVTVAVVEGDTTTAVGAALAMAYQQIPVIHVEAGLRVQAPYYPVEAAPFLQPYPEELNRILIGKVASLHLCPTVGNKANLLREGVPPVAIRVTGNPGITALVDTLTVVPSATIAVVGFQRVVVTCHRRENWTKLTALADELCKLVELDPTVHVTWVMHPNPTLQKSIPKQLPPAISLREPVDHTSMVQLVHDADLVVTDSGGLIEEATYLGANLVVLRETTERPEAGAPLINIDDACEGIRRALEKPLPRTSERQTAFGDESSARNVAEAIATFTP